MTRLPSTSALMVILCTTGAWGQSALPDGFDIDGHVNLAYSGFAGDDWQLYATTDLDVSWTNGTYGIDVSLIGFAAEGTSLSAFFGAVSYTFADQHKISFGAPRAAYDEFAGFRYSDYFESLGTIASFGGASSFLTIYNLVLEGDTYTILGLRYDGQVQGAEIAGSVHASPDGSGFLISSSARFQLNSGAVAGGFEYLDVDDIEVSNLMLRYDTRFGKFDLGAGFARTNIQPTVGPGSVTVSTYELAADYSFTDAISAGALWVQIFQDFGGPSMDQTFYGLRGKYGFAGGASANATAMKMQGDDDVQYSVSLRYDF